MVSSQNVELARVVEISRVELARGYCIYIHKMAKIAEFMINREIWSL